jgi:hypothetical protein
MRPITSLIFTHEGVAAASGRRFHFASLSNRGSVCPMPLPAPSFRWFSFAGASRDGCLRLISPTDFRLFRTHSLSRPRTRAISCWGPRSAPAASAPAFRFGTLADIVTRVVFHADDLVVGSHGGFVISRRRCAWSSGGPRARRRSRRELAEVDGGQTVSFGFGQCEWLVSAMLLEFLPR